MTIRPNSIVSETELNAILQQMSFDQNGFNPYENYIRKLQTEETNKKDNTGKPLFGIEKHHILPRFDGGTNEASNIVLVSVKEHVIAHWIRWKVLAKPQDYAAFLFRIGDTEEAILQRNLSVRAAREQDRIKGLFMYNPEWQQEMGKRGGPRGGSANTERQYEARRQVGLQYGRKTGMRNQGLGLSQFLSQYSIWAHSPLTQAMPRLKDRGPEFYCMIAPKPAFIDIVRSLNQFVPNAITLPSSFHKVVYGERKQMYGWRIVNTLIRSEVREGIQEFYTQNPNIVLHFEPLFLESEGLE